MHLRLVSIALCALVSGCVVNPVPTPGPEGTAMAAKDAYQPGIADIVLAADTAGASADVKAPDVVASDVAADALAIDATADAAADADIAPDATVKCCPLAAIPSCDCTQMGGSTDQVGGCHAECDTAPVGWTQAIDKNGCPYWKNIGQMCLLVATQCGGDHVDAPVFPAFSRACEQDSECAVAIHQINCCGSKVAIGINALVKSVFAAEEAKCEGQFPKCKCMQLPTKADDGKTAPDDAFAAKCDQKQCSSFVP